jgi:hypothetical protein
MAITRLKMDTLTTITWTTPPGTGVYRASVAQPNTNNRPALLMWFTFTEAAATTGAIVEVYLVRHNGAGTPIGDDSWAGVEATLTLRSSPMLGSMLNNGTAETLRKTFDTRTLGPVGPNWGIGIRNSSGGTITTGFGMTYKYYYTEVV